MLCLLARVHIWSIDEDALFYMRRAVPHNVATDL